MPRFRIIPTLLTDGVNLVKGEKFNSWRTVGFVTGAARVFALRDVDELVLLDVEATLEGRRISLDLVAAVAECLSVPLTVGGGLRTVSDVEAVLRHGADKVVIGSATVDNPTSIQQITKTFGSQAIVGSVDAANDGGTSTVSHSGSRRHDLDVVSLAHRLEQLGVGEILLQSSCRDGTMRGMDLSSIRRVCSAVSLPVIASGGASTYLDLVSAAQAGAAAVAVGAMFQFTERTPAGARDYLADCGIPVRHA